MLIGIPHYNDFEGLKKCIDSLQESIGYLVDIVIMNADKDRQEDILNAYGAQENIEIINIDNKGPLYAYNQLFKLAQERKRDLFLTQTDVYFPKCKKNWLAELEWYSGKIDCGMITCWNGGGISGPDFIDSFRWVGAWFVYIPYRTIEKIGGYDENIPLGYGVDIDYSYAVIQLGLKIYVIDYWVEHIPNYKDNHQHEHVFDFEQLKKEAFRYMREKWKVGEYAVIEAQEKIK